MKALVSFLCSLLALVGLTGCDPFVFDKIKPGITTDVEVRQLLGEPGMEWRNEDGSVTWEYSGQPSGTQCHMITIGPDRIVRSVEQVLNEKHFARIKAGMTLDEVRRVQGKHANTQFFALSQERVYNWNVDGGPTITDPVYFTVHFDTAGHVTRTSLNVQYRR